MQLEQDKGVYQIRFDAEYRWHKLEGEGGNGEQKKQWGKWSINGEGNQADSCKANEIAGVVYSSSGFQVGNGGKGWTAGRGRHRKTNRDRQSCALQKHEKKWVRFANQTRYIW